MNETSTIQIGKYLITPMGDGKVWIGVEGGEGGQFSEETFEAVIEFFYQENF